MTAALHETGLARYADLQTIHARTGNAVSTLRDWIRHGKLPAYRLPGNQIRVKEADVLALFIPVAPKY